MITLFRYAPLLILAVAWELVSRTGMVSELALPPLSRVAMSWFYLVTDGDFFIHAGASLWRVGAGLAISIILGGLLGILMAWWRPLNVIVNPIVELFYPVP